MTPLRDPLAPIAPTACILLAALELNLTGITIPFECLRELMTKSHPCGQPGSLEAAPGLWGKIKLVVGALMLRTEAFIFSASQPRAGVLQYGRRPPLRCQAWGLRAANPMAPRAIPR